MSGSARSTLRLAVRIGSRPPQRRAWTAYRRAPAAARRPTASRSAASPPQRTALPTQRRGQRPGRAGPATGKTPISSTSSASRSAGRPPPRPGTAAPGTATICGGTGICRTASRCPLQTATRLIGAPSSSGPLGATPRAPAARRRSPSGTVLRGPYGTSTGAPRLRGPPPALPGSPWTCTPSSRWTFRGPRPAGNLVWPSLRPRAPAIPASAAPGGARAVRAQAARSMGNPKMGRGQRLRWPAAKSAGVGGSEGAQRLSPTSSHCQWRRTAASLPVRAAGSRGQETALVPLKGRGSPSTSDMWRPGRRRRAHRPAWAARPAALVATGSGLRSRIARAAACRTLWDRSRIGAQLWSGTPLSRGSGIPPTRSSNRRSMPTASSSRCTAAASEPSSLPTGRTRSSCRTGQQ
mmetsp:Transcript_26688/g.63240  ORF Transcript_26688/g.63240 Transcript_26688/m.63240 type:complete len:408 (-) Transcript_26688:701-1924(-)